MTQLEDNFLDKVEKLAKSVKQDLKRKGFVVPSKSEDGTYIFENYKIKKEETGFYSIFDKNNELIVSKINLPQTAALLANDLALGKFLDSKLIDLDKNYGYRDFDCELFESASLKYRKTDLDKFFFYNTRYNLAREQKKICKEQILAKFEKLRRVR